MRLALAALALFAYGAFIWGAYSVFVSKGRASFKLTALKGLALVAAALEVFAIAGSDAGSLQLAFGAALYLGALGLFFWAVRTVRARPPSLAFSPDLPEHVFDGGPYRWVRHPFYASYVASYVAGWVGSGAHWLLAVVAVMGALYLDAGRLEEQKFAQSELAEQYRRYRESTGVLFPRMVGTRR